MVKSVMPVTVSAELETKLQTMVDSGLFDSVEAALRQAVESLLADEDGQRRFVRGASDQLLKEGIDQADRGEISDGDEAFARIRAHADQARRRRA